ncbi:hypothetical protein LPB90_18135 [Chryseobacterium sp. LC2016-29]|uniref:hypothetical protein n=1 Tax=Chryseobacterium sp. LC2016-29 TaxID=2897331 RepID=UPI001E4EE460|nr:hypothetical protein [Chryseobacterium sp. LC2016-29]MCD0480361.1 hypothetical protein [Chryseobacterium sp. LC2016-29]
MQIDELNILDILTFYENRIVIATNENELVLYKAKERGFVGTETYCIQLNGKIIKTLKRVPTVIKHLSSLIKNNSLEDGMKLLLSEYKLESIK